MTIIWCMVPEILSTTNRDSFIILDPFLHFNPLNNLKNQSFGKIKEHPGDIIILHMCTINDNHIIYGSWDIEHDGQNLLSFWTVFCPFKCTKNHDHMLYCSLDMARNGCSCYFSFWTSFCPFTLLTSWKIKVWKKRKNVLEISSFHNSVPKIMIIGYTVSEI